MTIYYRTEFIAGLSFALLASDPNVRVNFNQSLNDYGNQGWAAYHLEEAGNGLLVFLRKSAP